MRILGVTNVLWLGAASWATTRTVTWTTCADSSMREPWSRCEEKNASDANYAPLEETGNGLKGMRLEDGSKPEVVPFRCRRRFTRRPSAARKLREFLHRQRMRARPDIQRSERPDSARDTLQSSSPIGPSSAYMPSISFWDSERSTASRSSSPANVTRFRRSRPAEFPVHNPGFLILGILRFLCRELGCFWLSGVA